MYHDVSACFRRHETVPETSWHPGEADVLSERSQGEIQEEGATEACLRRTGANGMCWSNYELMYWQNA